MTNQCQITTLLFKIEDLIITSNTFQVNLSVNLERDKLFDLTPL